MASSDDSELDYHITFPSPASFVTDEQPSADDGYEIDQAKEPVVILLGWLGCQDNHLAKYSEIYEKNKCITIRYVAPPSEILTFRNNTSKLSSIAYKILELLTDLSLEDNPLFFHVFSNGGCIIYQHISSHICNNPEFNDINVMGCIFDSCPGQGSIKTATRVFITTLRKPPVISYILGFFFYIFMVFLKAYRTIKRSVPILNNAASVKLDCWSYMMDEPSRWPQMFLYSKKDEIVNYKSVSSVISRRIAVGVDVADHCWEDSPHVQHYRYHKEVYINLCHSFVHKCLKQSGLEGSD